MGGGVICLFNNFEDSDVNTLSELTLFIQDAKERRSEKDQLSSLEATLIQTTHESAVQSVVKLKMKDLP